MIQSYILSEKDSDQVFAVIKDIDTEKLKDNFYADLVNKVGQAIEDENNIEERIKVIHDEETLKSVIFPDEFGNHIFYMSFIGIGDDDEEIIFEVELNQVTIY